MTDHEVLDAEAKEMAQALPAVRASEAIIARGEITATEVLGQREKIREVMNAVMEKGVHYGEIPGILKPTLLKPGAEVLAVTFRLAPSYQSEKLFQDDSHLTVISTATLTHIPTGMVVAEGEGLCTSREKKYAYRGEGRACPVCGVFAIKRSKFPPRPGDYQGASKSDEPGWYCHAKVGGCGANFAANDPRIVEQEAGKIPNPELPDTWNTVLKMANKRALVAAILNGTAASDIFTQDAEDAHASASEPAEAPRPAEPAQPERSRTDRMRDKITELCVKADGVRGTQGATWQELQQLIAWRHDPDGGVPLSAAATWEDCTDDDLAFLGGELAAFVEQGCPGSLAENAKVPF